VCTVTWVRGLASRLPGGDRPGGSIPGGDWVELLTNRDEQRSRPPAVPPRLHRASNGMRYLAPVDERGGGTWIAANEAGIALCLLNHYQAAELAPGLEPRSRGLIVTDLAGARDLDGVVESLRNLDLGAARGFRLVALDGAGGLRLCTWDTATLVLDRDAAVSAPLISSGFDLDGVQQARRQTFATLSARHGGVTRDMLVEFHASELPEPGPYAVSMGRADAQTVSHTRVRIDAQAIEMHYQPGRPADRGAVQMARLERSTPQPT